MASKASTILSVDLSTQRVTHDDPKKGIRTDRFQFLTKTTRIATLKWLGFIFSGKPPLHWNDDELMTAWLSIVNDPDSFPAPEVPQPKKEVPMPKATTTTTTGGGLDDILRNIVNDVIAGYVPEPDKELVREIAMGAVAPVIASNEALMQEVQSLSDAVEQRLPRVTKVTVPGREPREVPGVLHAKFGKVLSSVANRLPTYLVGPAGTGKSTIGEQVATALGLSFSATSLCAQTTVYDLLGYMDAQGRYVETGFYRAYKNGGVKLFDEVDNGNPNVLSVLNSALSNSFMEFPNGEMVRRHDDFVAMATANTFGNGATSEYVGRNPLDKAFLDRFVSITIEIDDKVERAMLDSIGLAPDRANRWLEIVQKCRLNVQTYGLKVIVSPRATMRGATLLTDSDNWNYSEVAEATILGGLSDDQRSKVLDGVRL